MPAIENVTARSLKSLFCWRGHCDPTLFSLRWPMGRGTPLRSRQRSREPQAHIISIRVPSSLRYPHFTGSAPTRGFQIAPSLRLLKSLFCWRRHCDETPSFLPSCRSLKSLFCWRRHCDSHHGLPGGAPGSVEILVLLEEALRPHHPEILRVPSLLKSLFCWRGHCDRAYRGHGPSEERLKSLFYWRGHCDWSMLRR